ncbi:uncharacterized protein LOC116845962 isoform X2 [Odontomachus brunneus]|uniref:uncharacterized protein LOC116845962 isoform X2 n=1 Tax=Odontomachus brunneus TaxID=486640 RepID=UPI0013F226E6|nr:uncharacterized protein LOC116845962 isoform X2 [Odontomachus brunneus]
MMFSSSGINNEEILMSLDSWGDEVFSNLTHRELEFHSLNEEELTSIKQEISDISIAEEKEEIIFDKMLEGKNQVSLDSFLLAFNELQSCSIDNSELSKVNGMKDKIKIESPYSQFLTLTDNFNDSSDSTASDWKSEVSKCSPMQNMDKLILQTPPTSPQSLSVQSSQSFLDVPNLTKPINILPANKRIINHKDKIIRQKAGFIKDVHTQLTNTKDKLQNTIILRTPDGTAFVQNADLQQQKLHASKAQSLSTTGQISTLDSVNIDTTDTKTKTALQLSQNIEIFDAIPNFFHENLVNSLMKTPVYIKSEPISLDDIVLKSEPITFEDIVLKNEPISFDDILLKSEPINCTPFIMRKKNETDCASLIKVKEKTDTLNSPGSKIECESIQALKRQQRMIKNRESACLSRKKKKEYVHSLEKRLSELKEENENLKMENNLLKQKLINLEDGIISNKRKVGILNRNRKGIALFVILCMVSVNINTLGILSWNINLKNLLNKASISVPDIDEIKHSRTLLWTGVDENNNDIRDQIEESFNKNIPVYQPVCPNINQSESIRLDSELRRWIDGESDRDNWTTSARPKFLLSSLPLEGKTRRKLYLSQDKKIKPMHKMIDVPTATSNAVQVFSPILSEHASLFEALGRRDDTFYVVWFTGKHLLLPASRTNDTARPKMSLILPAVSIKGTFSTPPDHVTMMQIDCEVTNTQLLHLQQSIIPIHLRDNKSTSQSNRSHSVEDIVNSSTANIRNIRNQKPYFIKEANRKALYRKNFEDKYEDKNIRDFRNKNTIYVYKDNF